MIDREHLAFLGREPDRDEEADYSPEFEAWNARELAREVKYKRVMAKLARRRASRMPQDRSGVA